MKVVELEILGQRLAVKSDGNDDYIRAVEAFLNNKVNEIKSGSKAVTTLDIALLAALNVTGELLKARETIEMQEKRSEELIQLINGRVGEV